MTPRRARFRPPVSGRTASHARPALGLPLLMAAAVALGACSASDPGEDGAAQTADTAETTEDSTGSSSGDDTADGGASDSSASDGYTSAEDAAGDTLSFGDPVDDGFAEVQDILVEPEETPEADFDVLSAPEDVVPEVADQLEAAPAASIKKLERRAGRS